ncbi:MAG: efflux RND transporter periplasmic adaptor subunit [Bacteroidota bacterium]
MKKIILFCFFFLYGISYAHEGHGDENKKKNSETAAEQLVSEASSDKYELLVKYDELAPGEESEFLLFVSNYITNQPIDSINISIICRENKSQTFQVERADPGIYRVKTIFPEKSNYSLLIQIDGGTGSDLILLENIKTGISSTEPLHDDHSGSWGGIWLFISGTAAGIIIMFLFLKLGGKKTKAALLLLLFNIGSFPESYLLNAHEGHGEMEKNQSSAFTGTSFSIPKETQFLFEMTTVKAETGTYEEVTKLYGTVLPSNDGYAAITSAQNGRITSLKIKVGGKVKKGDQLALVEQIPDAASQVNLLAERNNLEAEFEAAKKDIERHEKIKDIISKKEADEAIARYQKAKENLELFNSSSGRSIILRSPIDGIIGNFNLSVGSPVMAGDTLFSITNLSHVFIEAQVYDRDVQNVMDGGKFVVECINDDHKTAEVSIISAAQTINPTNQSQRFLFEMKNPDGDFKIGEFVNVRVFAKEKSHELALPNSAISEINGRPVVFIKDAAEKFSVSYISPGENNGEYTVIKKGVEEGERVIITGSYQAKMIYLNQ